MALHDDIKGLVDKQGKQVLLSKNTANILADISTDYNNNPAIKSIFKAMLDNGYVVSLFALEQEEEASRLLKSQGLSTEYAQKHGYKEAIVNYLTSCFQYALGWIDSVNMVSSNIQHKRTKGSKKASVSGLTREKDSQNEEMSSSIAVSELDSIFEEVARLVVAEQQVSTSFIQRKFSIGFARCGRIIDQLERAGIVGSLKGPKPREVLVADEDKLDILLSTLFGCNRTGLKAPTSPRSTSDGIIRKANNTPRPSVSTNPHGKTPKRPKFYIGCIIVLAIAALLEFGGIIASTMNNDNPTESQDTPKIALIQVIDSLFEQDKDNNWENSVVAKKYSMKFTERFIKALENDTSIIYNVPLYLSGWKSLPKGKYLLAFYGGDSWSKIDWEEHDIRFNVYCVVSEEVVMTLNQGMQYWVRGTYQKKISSKLKSQIVTYKENVEITTASYDQKIHFDLHDFFVENPTITESK